MMTGRADHTLEFLLDFDGHVHRLEQGYWIKFQITIVKVTSERPHGLSYSFTLHAPDGTRLVGFDNAHGVPAVGSGSGRGQRQAITGIGRWTIPAGRTNSKTRTCCLPTSFARSGEF